MRKIVALLVCCTALSGTAFARDIPVVSYGAGVGYGSSGGHTVERGETIAGIAKSYRLSVPEIAQANGLSSSAKLKPGQRLMIPPPREYTVKKGDSIDLVARTFSVSIDAIARSNGIAKPYRLAAGQVLRVPRVQYADAPARFERAVYTRAMAAPAGHVQVMTLPPVSIETTPERPNLPAVMKVKMPSLGTLTVKHAGGSFSEAVIRAAGVDAKTTPRPEVKPAVVRPMETPDEPLATVQPASYPAPAMPDIPERDDGRFLKPVNGPVISGYGRKKDGLYNEGINISATRGTPVRAAENGVVVYVGNAVEGYGNLILIKHADRYVTAYAHLEKAMVKERQKVRRGQTIGTVGSSGNVDRAQLHFEIRKGREPINPSAAI